MKKGVVICEGKTKVIHEAVGLLGQVIIGSKDDITKNDDPSATRIMDSKAIYSTATTCAVFSLLKQAGLPVAFERQISETEFLAPSCRMIPLEVVIRRYKTGSYLKRYPHEALPSNLPPKRFHKLEFELFLKTTRGEMIGFDGMKYGMTPKIDDVRYLDDPLIADPQQDDWELRDPKLPSWAPGSDIKCQIFRSDVLPNSVTVEKIEEFAKKAFLVLERAWAIHGFRLVDYKIELGLDHNGNLLIADVIDNDSWRLRTRDWKELSKQLFRDNASMSEISARYALVSDLVSKFSIPDQAIVIWSGSKSDPVPEVPLVAGVNLEFVIKSGHKEPMLCAQILEDLLSTYPAGLVFVANVGMSNGLGPFLAARTCCPVITVPITASNRPHDVWSSLEMPKEVPLNTILSQNNAVLSALNMLAVNNPAAYMYRQCMIEKYDI
jgi:phosphoribosylaminoimidazole carboxylase/phosphoribosylaminoimidazole-succinocarboxamide synthase